MTYHASVAAVYAMTQDPCDELLLVLSESTRISSTEGSSVGMGEAMVKKASISGDEVVVVGVVGVVWVTRGAVRAEERGRVELSSRAGRKFDVFVVLTGRPVLSIYTPSARMLSRT